MTSKLFTIEDLEIAGSEMLGLSEALRALGTAEQCRSIGMALDLLGGNASKAAAVIAGFVEHEYAAKRGAA